MSEIKLTADSGGGSVSLKGPATTTGNAAMNFVLPVADGSAGQYLKTDGSKNFSFGTPSGGKVLQVVSSVKTDTFTKGTSTDWLDIDGTDQAGSGSVWCCKITPSAATSKVLVLAALAFSTTYYGSGRLVRDSTAIAIGAAGGSRTQGTWGSGYASTGMSPLFSVPFLDSPASTSELTYKAQIATPHSASYQASVNVPTTGDADAAYITRPVSIITLIEVGA